MERNERRVDDDQVETGRKCVIGQRSEIRAFDDGHPRIGAQLPRELTVTDVEGGDVPRAAREYDVGEAAGRRADIEYVPPLRREIERAERSRELLAPAANVGGRLPDIEHRTGSQE